jgi:hypothetical protein
MQLVLTRKVTHPCTYETLFDIGDILRPADIDALHKRLGIDEILGHICLTHDAAKHIQKQVLAET